MTSAMRTIGLLSGMSFGGSVASRIINEGVRERLGVLNFAELIMDEGSPWLQI